MNDATRRTLGTACGVMAAVAWLYASLVSVGGNVDTFGILILLVLASPIVGVLGGWYVTACLRSPRPIVGILSAVSVLLPATGILAISWASRAPQREESRRLGRQIDTELEAMARLGWKAPPELKRTGGGSTRFSYSVQDLELTSRMMDEKFGWDKMDFGRSRYWLKRTGSDLIWANAYETGYSSPRVAFDVWRAPDTVLLGKVAHDLVRGFRVANGVAVLANSRVTNGPPTDLSQIKEAERIKTKCPDIIEDLVIESTAARVDIGIGYSGTKTNLIAFVRVHWIRQGDAWAISRLERIPSRSPDHKRQVREVF